MCGIAGIVGRRSASERWAVEQMVRALGHRGPDDHGTKVLDGAVLGHTRLSIIDLVTGQQPMASVDGRYWITYNGEIYNFKALRRDLEKAGHRFRTHSDTEVLLELYRAEGSRCVNRLNGMFSFAIWDERERTLFAARDRMGKKPFFYHVDSDRTLTFASEIKALLASTLVDVEPDQATLDAYLMLGYVPPHRTAYRGLEVLPPAHWLVWSEAGVRVERYWDVPISERVIAEADAAEELRARLDMAVEARMVADVPVGAFLSGGLDSSTVVSLMQRHASHPVKTFCVGIKNHLDERPFARAVAEQEGTEHHEVEVDIEVGDALWEMANIYDEPFGDSSNIPTYLVSRFAREHVKVVLTGDGGDEILAGYEWWYQPLLKLQRAHASGLRYYLLRLAFKMAAGMDTKRLISPSWFAHIQERYWNAVQARRHKDVLERHFLRTVRFSSGLRALLWGREAGGMSVVDEINRCPHPVQGLNRAFWFDVRSWLPGDILVKVDRASMAVGLEARCPLLDPDVVEFALALPVSLKLAGDEGKYIFRKAFSALWPPAVRQRGKMGFGVPEAAWLERSDVRDLAEAYLVDGNAPVQRWMDGAEIRRRVRNYYAGVRESIADGFSPKQMWTLLMLALWFARWSSPAAREEAARMGTAVQS